MDSNNQAQQSGSNQELIVKELTPEQSRQLQEGIAIREMTQTMGWKIVKQWLLDRANHTWVDPRGLTKDEWEWAELNAYHSHDVAKELLLEIQEAITLSDQLQDVRLGKDQPQRIVLK